MIVAQYLGSCIVCATFILSVGVQEAIKRIYLLPALDNWQSMIHSMEHVNREPTECAVRCANHCFTHGCDHRVHEGKEERFQSEIVILVRDRTEWTCLCWKIG